MAKTHQVETPSRGHPNSVSWGSSSLPLKIYLDERFWFVRDKLLLELACVLKTAIARVLMLGLGFNNECLDHPISAS